MEITTFLLQITTLRSTTNYKTAAGGRVYIFAKKRLMEIMETPVWQTVGSPLVSHAEGLCRAHSNNQTL